MSIAVSTGSKRSWPVNDPRPHAPLSAARTLPIEGIMVVGVKVLGVEGLDMGQQRLGEAATLDLVVRQGPLQVGVQRLQCRVAIDLGEPALVVDDLAVAEHGAHTAGF